MNRRGQLAGAYIERPIALDAPLSRFAAERKGIASPLVENTDIFIAPDIEAANIFCRSILYFAKGGVLRHRGGGQGTADGAVARREP